MVIVDIIDPEFSSRADKLKFLAKFQTFVNKFSPFIQNILTSKSLRASVFFPFSSQLKDCADIIIEM